MTPAAVLAVTVVVVLAVMSEVLDLVTGTGLGVFGVRMGLAEFWESRNSPYL